MTDTKESQKEEATDLEKIKKQAEEYLDGWKRAKADYINLKKESEKKLTESVQFANAALILEMLPVNDHFKLAMDHIPKEEKEKEWVKGIMNIQKEFSELLSRMGIEEIKTVGEEFNPELHEAVTREKVDKVKSNTIIKEITPGYKLFDKVLQVAKVHVAE
ncbi:MAG: nucleotide exchange factor GrpE [Candidatus Helarchaeales archaeon]